MVREAWTDERLDELSNRTDRGFVEAQAEFRTIRGEMGEMRAEIGGVRAEIGEVRAELKGVNRTLQIGFGLIGSFLGVLGILIATQL